MKQDGPRILLSGATGFIGLNLLELLVRDKADVTVLARPSSDLTRIRELAPNTPVVSMDMRQGTELASTVREIGPDLCIHLAWYAVPGRYPHDRANIAMLSSSCALAEAVYDTGCRRFIGVGTCSELDSQYGYLSESTPPRPLNLYASAKHAFLLLLEQLALQYEATYAWARLFYQYGPWEAAGRLVPTVIDNVLEGRAADVTAGNQVRDYLHAEDVASAILAIARSDVQGPVHVGSAKPVAVKDLVLLLARLLEAEHLINVGAKQGRPDEPEFICANNRKLRQATGWSQRISLEDGLMRTIEWRRNMFARTREAITHRRVGSA